MSDQLPESVPAAPRRYQSPKVRPTGLSIRQAEAKDCRILWEFVNDPEVRANSFSPSQIPWEGHQDWFKQKIEAPKSRIFIAEDEKQRIVGQLRVELRSERDGDIDVSVARELRGTGYGTLLIDLAVYRSFAETGVQTLHALIRRENQASRRAFESAEFHYLEEVTINGFATLHYVRNRPQQKGGEDLL